MHFAVLNLTEKSRTVDTVSRFSLFSYVAIAQKRMSLGVLDSRSGWQHEEDRF
jgi:hypothetical protein